MICHWRIPRMRMGVTREGDGALTSTAVPSPVSPGLSPRQGLAPFWLCCSHCKVRLPYLLGFSTGGQFVESLAVKAVVFPVMCLPSGCPAIQLLNFVMPTQNRQEDGLVQDLLHTAQERSIHEKKILFFFLNEKTNARNGHSWVKMN